MELARPAEAGDREACTRLLELAFHGARAMRGGPALLGEATIDGLLERWGRPGAALFVGQYETAVVGLLGVRLTGAVAGRVGALVECCYVEDGARGVGVGNTLMEAAVAWGRVQGCTEVDALALPGDRALRPDRSRTVRLPWRS